MAQDAEEWRVARQLVASPPCIFSRHGCAIEMARFSKNERVACIPKNDSH